METVARSSIRPRRETEFDSTRSSIRPRRKAEFEWVCMVGAGVGRRTDIARASGANDRVRPGSGRQGAALRGSGGSIGGRARDSTSERGAGGCGAFAGQSLAPAWYHGRPRCRPKAGRKCPRESTESAAAASVGGGSWTGRSAAPGQLRVPGFFAVRVVLLYRVARPVEVLEDLRGPGGYSWCGLVVFWYG